MTKRCMCSENVTRVYKLSYFVKLVDKRSRDKRSRDKTFARSMIDENFT